MPQQFLVPQFIDVETKIIGPITTRQFFIMLVDAMVCFIYYKLFFFNTFVIATVLTTVIFGIVAFAKINGAQFHYFFLNMVSTLKKPRIRMWGKITLSSLPKVEEAKKEVRPPTKAAPLSSRLASLTLLVDTGGAYAPEE